MGFQVNDNIPRPAANPFCCCEMVRRVLEVFMVRRHEGSGAFRGAHVFPGGRVDPDDAADSGWCDGVDKARRQLPDLAR